MVQNPIWIRRNQGNSSTKEITIKIDASCHVGIPISIYLSISSAASDISIIGADWVHPPLMRINSERSWGMGTAAITGTSLTSLKQWESWFFPGAVLKGGGRRGQSWMSPGTQWGLVGVPHVLSQAVQWGWAPDSGDHGRSVLLPGAPAHCPAHLQLIHQHQLGQEWPQWTCNGSYPCQMWCTATSAWDCSRLQGRLAQRGQEHNGATRKGKNQKCKIKQGRVGIPRERTPLKWSSWRTNCSRKLIQGCALIWGCSCHNKEPVLCHAEPSATSRGNTLWPKEPVPAQRGVRELPLTPVWQLWHGLVSCCYQQPLCNSLPVPAWAALGPKPVCPSSLRTKSFG